MIVTGVPRRGFRVIVKDVLEALDVDAGVVVDVEVRARLV